MRIFTHQYLQFITAVVFIWLIKTNCIASQTEIVKPEQNEITYGVALYHYFQSDYFRSITDLLIARQQSPIPELKVEAELLLGGMFHAYGLDRRANEVFSAVAADDANALDESVLSQVRFSLGKSYYKNAVYQKARAALLSVEDHVNKDMQSEWLYMLGAIYIAQQQYDEARQLLSAYPENSVWKAYAEYNLGLQLAKHNRTQGKAMLERVSKIRVTDDEQQELSNAAAFSLASLYLDEKKYQQAINHFNNVELNSLRSNSALLGLGWAFYLNESFSKARQYWYTLSLRSSKNADVQEALSLLPLVSMKQGRISNALAEYKVAIKKYSNELSFTERLLASIKVKGISQLLPTKTVANKRLNDADVVLENSLKAYLPELFASNQFDLLYNNFAELNQLEQVLEQWGGSVVSLKNIIDEKTNTFNKRLPDVMSRLELSKKVSLLEQRDKYLATLVQASQDETMLALSSVEEQESLALLNSIDQQIKVMDQSDDDVQELAQKQRFLSGLLTWNIGTDFAPRKWMAETAISQLDVVINDMELSMNSLKSAMQDSPAKHARYAAVIAGKQEKISELTEQVSKLKNSVESQLHQLVTDAIQAYRVRLMDYQDRARYGQAHAYDKLLLQTNNEDY